MTTKQPDVSLAPQQRPHSSRRPTPYSCREAGAVAPRLLNGDLATPTYPIIVHSHLRWDWVWQRPQQFLTRLSARHPILFIEEPIACSSKGENKQPSAKMLPNATLFSAGNGSSWNRWPRAWLAQAEGFPNIRLVRPEVPAAMLSDQAALDSEIKRLAYALLGGPWGKTFKNPVQWFYNPLAIPAVHWEIQSRAVVYDCMDELSQFRGAPPHLIERERRLLEVADVVFTGGPKIYEAKRRLTANCHCYGCGVESEHFGEALNRSLAVPPDLQALKSPVLGFFGVIDERLDYELIAALCDAHPEWKVVLIGPITKVTPNELPQRENLYWRGACDYADLPAAIKSFDVALMPFARNAATEFINPTKALEMMATGRPIVSTAIDDVVSQFEKIILIGRSVEEFIGHCERAIAAPDRARVTRGLKRAQLSSWEKIVSNLEGHIEEVLLKRAPTVD